MFRFFSLKSLMFACVSWTFDFLLIKVPLLVIAWLPRCESITSLVHLYVFVQALGILWLLFVTAVAVSATKLGSVWIHLSNWDLVTSLPFYVLRVYIHFSILQVGLGFGKSLWSNGWEIYGDFPTGRSILNPKSALTKSTRVAQKLFLLCPLIVSGVVAAILGLVQLSLKYYAPEEGSVRIGLGDPEGRLNRILRFTVWIGLLQWAQIFQYVFPTWHRAVSVFSRGKLFSLFLGFLILVPISVLRCLQWVIAITPPANAQLASIMYMFGGVSWDCLLMVSWALVMYSVAREVLGSKSHLVLASWKRQAFVDESIWCEGATLLKFGFLFAAMLLFLRSFLSPHKGFSYAQNDLILLTVSYPLFMVITCWSTSIALTLAKRKWAGFTVIVLGPVSAFLCSISGLSAGGAVVAFWLHLIKQFVRLKKSINGVGFGQIESVGPRNSNGSERLVARSVLRVALPFTYVYGFLLLVLSVLSLVQQQVSSGPPNEFLSVVRPNNNTVSVRHAVSEMSLFLTPEESTVELPRYAICGKKIFGLDVIDYGLFSMISYLDDPISTQKATNSIFPAEKEWEITVFEDSKYIDKFWTEFRLSKSGESPLIVIAVRGSEFWRVADYLEDLRMWTEPVAKSLLTLVFPTVRAWSPKTTAMVFDANQEILAFIGIPDDAQYKYQRILEYIEHRRIESGGTQIVLTGHSLGGGIASIAGAIAQLPTVTFLSPGMYQAASKFFYHTASRTSGKASADMIHHQSVSIQVENDFVGKYLDSHAGLVQTITCSVDHLAPLTCHLIDNSVCNLIRHCKDPRWPGGCDFKYDFDIFINATFPEQSYQELHRLVLSPIAKMLNKFFDPERGTRREL